MSPTTTHTLERPGGSLAYDRRGTGPVIICVPGMGDIRSTYRHIADALAQEGFTVVTLDLRGHGASDTTFAEYDDVAVGGDVLALIDHLGLGPALVVGNSMGAGAAAWAAAERPDAVAGIALLGPFVRNAPLNPLLALSFRILMGGPWAVRAWLAYLPRLYPTGGSADLREHRDRIAAALRRPGAARAFRRTTRTSHAPVAARLGEITRPSLVIMGGADPDFPDPTAEARWIGERLGSRVTVLDNIGHYPQAEAPEATLAALTPFAREAHRG